jgi:predicted RNA binding protein YcfA (HicA-like mRNA interferase family)
VRFPRNISAQQLITALKKLGYEETRRKGSYIRLTTLLDGTHHETIPNHDPIKIGTLQAILKSIASHHHLTVQELIQRLKL